MGVLLRSDRKVEKSLHTQEELSLDDDKLLNSQTLSKSRQQSRSVQQVLCFYWWNNVSEEFFANSCVDKLGGGVRTIMSQNEWAWRDPERAESTRECAGNEESQQNGGFNLINSAREWQQQSAGALCQLVSEGTECASAPQKFTTPPPPPPLPPPPPPPHHHHHHHLCPFL